MTREPARSPRDRRRRLGLFIGVLVALSACGSATPAPGFGKGELSIATPRGAVRVSVLVASTSEAKAQGLMGRSHLPESSGMAFLSDQPTTTPFWMKDTTIPLSVAFWNTHHRIVDMLDMSPCTADPCPLYRSPSPYVGAVEVNRGFFEQHGVSIGDRVQLHPAVSF